MVPPDTPAPPKFATPRSPGLKTYGPAISAVAASMRTPLMPWQHLAADLQGEVHPDGRFRHPFIIITVPRQSGKTTLVLAAAVHRCLYMAARRVWYTAETGKKARDKWGEMLDSLEADNSPLRQLIKRTKRSNGDELLTFINGSTLNPFPPTRDGLHSKQSDLVDIDEGWAHSEADGAAILAGVTPTQATRPFRQVVVLSTMGDAASVWFHRLVDAAKGEGDAPDGIDQLPALVEYGVPDGTDADDLDTVAAYHPAYGYTIDMQALIDARAQLIAANGVELGKAEFLRAYGNLRSGSTVRVIPLTPWNAAATADVVDGAPAYGVAVAEDGSHGSIWAGWVDPVGRVVVELVARKPGIGWMVDALVALNGQQAPRIGVAADPGGPAGPVVAEYRNRLTRGGRVKTDRPPVLPMTRGDYAAACADVFHRITDAAGPRWLWRPEPEDHAGVLSAAVAITNKLTLGDGAFVWGRRASGGSIADFEAATLAGYAALRAPRGSTKPKIFVPAVDMAALAR